MSNEPIFYRNNKKERRCCNFENDTVEKGCGGKENDTAKGHAFDSVEARSSRTIFDISGSGVIDHIWLTFSSEAKKMDPLLLRGLKIEMYWENENTPAVSAPLGDFFGLALSETTEYENALFTSPGGNALNCYVQMPFLRAGKIVLVNESDIKVTRLFYQIDYYLDASLDAEKILYFHANWRREKKTVLKRDFEILPQVKGNGMFLGVNLGVISSPDYPDTWWGEGEIKFYIDGDGAFPTLIGTGTEDYIGTGWGMAAFAHQYQGSLIAKGDRFCFYRYHMPDPIYFREECRISIQQIGGGSKSAMLKLKEAGARFEIVSVDKNAKGFIKLYEQNPPIALEDDIIEMDSWCNFYREDDFCATAYYYLDNPAGVLPAADMSMAD